MDITAAKFFHFHCLTLQDYNASDMIEEMMSRDESYRHVKKYQAGELHISLIERPKGKLPTFVPAALITYEAGGIALTWIESHDLHRCIDSKFLRVDIEDNLIGSCRVDLEGFLNLRLPAHIPLVGE